MLLQVLLGLRCLWHRSARATARPFLAIYLKLFCLRLGYRCWSSLGRPGVEASERHPPGASDGLGPGAHGVGLAGRLSHDLSELHEAPRQLARPLAREAYHGVGLYSDPLSRALVHACAMRLARRHSALKALARLRESLL